MELEQAYLAIPIVTRVYVTLSVLLAGAATFEFLDPLTLYLNFSRVEKGEVWRLLTTFVFFDKFTVSFFFHMNVLFFYSRKLEEHHYHHRTARYFFMLLFGAVCMLLMATFGHPHLPFLSHSLVVMIMYVWARRNPDEHLHIYGVVTISVPYLVYVLIAHELLLGYQIVDILYGLCTGHLFWFVEDILPRILGRRGELIPTPGFITALFPEEA